MNGGDEPMPIAERRDRRTTASLALRRALFAALAAPAGSLTVARRSDRTGERLVVRAVSAAALPVARPARFAGVEIDWEVVTPPLVRGR
jgi:hypothetical protein